ncbi:MAG: hypothetical protein WD042_12930 [Phycisphaeraceae bacterium]
MHPLQHVGFAIGVLLASTFFALLEIQIEGAQGWARNLPCWRLDTPWSRRLLGGRPLTGYHFYFHLLVLTLVHLPFLMGLATWTGAAELRIIAFLMLFFIIEDFLWFLLNPAFGLRGFSPQAIWWHRHAWWWFMPRDYWIFLPLGVGLYVLSCIPWGS